MPVGTSLFAVKPMLMPFASGSFRRFAARLPAVEEREGRATRSRVKSSGPSDQYDLRLSPDQCR